MDSIKARAGRGRARLSASLIKRGMIANKLGTFVVDHLRVASLYLCASSGVVAMQYKGIA